LRRYVPALALDDADAPAAWQPGLASLRIALRAAGVDCRVFGSLAMQTLTGERYLGAGSDVDLLLRPLERRPARRRPGAGGAPRAKPAAGRRDRIPLRACGVLEGVAGRANSGSGGADRVLAKHLDAVALLRRDELLGQFGANEGRHG
jgi:hypothetical protein